MASRQATTRVFRRPGRGTRLRCSPGARRSSCYPYFRCTGRVRRPVQCWAALRPRCSNAAEEPAQVFTAVVPTPDLLHQSAPHTRSFSLPRVSKFSAKRRRRSDIACLFFSRKSCASGRSAPWPKAAWRQFRRTTMAVAQKCAHPLLRTRVRRVEGGAATVRFVLQYCRFSDLPPRSCRCSRVGFR